MLYSVSDTVEVGMVDGGWDTRNVKVSHMLQLTQPAEVTFRVRLELDGSITSYVSVHRYILSVCKPTVTANRNSHKQSFVKIRYVVLNDIGICRSKDVLV